MKINNEDRLKFNNWCNYCVLSKFFYLNSICIRVFFSIDDQSVKISHYKNICFISVFNIHDDITIIVNENIKWSFD